MSPPICHFTNKVISGFLNSSCETFSWCLLVLSVLPSNTTQKASGVPLSWDALSVNLKKEWKWGKMGETTHVRKKSVFHYFLKSLGTKVCASSSIQLLDVDGSIVSNHRITE